MSCQIADRLCASIGQDILDCLFSRSTLEPLSHRVPVTVHTFRPMMYFVLALAYNGASLTLSSLRASHQDNAVLHTLVMVYQMISLNVAVNSYDHALLTLLLSNQFVEIKGSVFKKFEKDNEKRQADGEKPFPEKELKERLKAADELDKKLKKEYKTKKVEAEGKGATVEKILGNIKKIDERIETLKLQAADRDGNKEVALGTSKIVSNLSNTFMWPLLTIYARTTSTLASQWSFPRSLMFPLRSFSPRPSARNSIGLSNRSKTMMIGSSRDSRRYRRPHQKPLELLRYYSLRPSYPVIALSLHRFPYSSTICINRHAARDIVSPS